MTTLLNILTVDPADQEELLATLQENTDTVIRTLDGWISTTLIAAADGARVIIHSQWRDAAAVEGMRNDARMVPYFPKVAALASLDSIFGEIAYTTAA
ncbi:quinol monooxygenase YgiN [Sphingomonas sp. UYAg733]